MNLKICSTKNFKKGDTLWFCNFELQPSGRAKNNIKPRSIKVTKVYQDRIEVDLGNDYGLWGLPRVYNIDSDDKNLSFGNWDYNNSLGVHISFSKEESEIKYNKMIEEAIEKSYQKFKRTEFVLQRMFL